MPRIKPDTVKQNKAGAYYRVPADSTLTRFSSGCALLDCVLGGSGDNWGWCLGRMENIIGDKSTAKTGLAIEQMANFAPRFPKGWLKYREAESAFDDIYAQRELGLPRERVRFWEDDYGADSSFDTVEQLMRDFDRILEGKDPKADPNEPGLYIVDSLDAISDEDEMESEVGEGSYGGKKPKLIGQFFRERRSKIERSKICFTIISQVRDNIGVTFGKKLRRSGGKALDFYATHCLWLSPLGFDSPTRGGIKRAVAINVRARCEKNKAGRPMRECDFRYEFDFGVADVETHLDWLKENKLLGDINIDEKKIPAFIKTINSLDSGAYAQARADLGDVVKEAWIRIEQGFSPPRKKYA